nr:hypothetical protein [Tanacetum cinerariifolium]
GVGRVACAPQTAAFCVYQGAAGLARCSRPGGAVDDLYRGARHGVVGAGTGPQRTAAPR